MNLFETISLVLNLLFVSGGLVTLLTLKSHRKKVEAEAEQSDASAQTTKIENEQKASQILLEYIVSPLKKEINALRKDVRALNRAIAKINTCTHADSCPVLRELQNQEAGNNDI